MFLLSFVRRGGGRPVVILNDAVEQHYRKEKIPHITLMDRASVVQRRLMVAFPHYSTRAAMVLKGGARSSFVGGGKDSSAKGDGQVYLFAAVPPTDAFSKVLGAVSRSGVVVDGYGLLPVESADMVKKLTDKLAKQKQIKDTSVWSVLIGQHHGGGLRQIVIKNGELALTRITPVPVPDDVDAGHWAGDVAHEFQATLSYLTRFGYSPDDGLNVIVVGNTFYGEQLEEMISVPCSYHSISVTEASGLLGMSIVGDDVHYADFLHAAWIAGKTSLTLSLVSSDLKKISTPRKAASVAMLLLTLGVGYEAFVVSNEAQAVYAISKNTEIAKERRAEIERLYMQEIARKEGLGIDVKLIQGALAVDKDIKGQVFDPLIPIDKVSRQLRSLRVDGFEFLNVPQVDAAPNPDPAASAPNRKTELRLRFSFAGTVKPQDGNKELYDLRQRLESVLPAPDYQVTVSKELVDLSYTGEVTSEVGLTAIQRKAAERFTGEILIQKVRNAGNSGT